MVSMNNDKWTITEIIQEKVKDCSISEISEVKANENCYTYTTDLKRKAERGDAVAQYELAIHTSNHEKAFYWYQKAAEQGHVGAQYALEYCYTKGIGTTKDLRKAKYWYERANNNSRRTNKENYNIISEKQTVTPQKETDTPQDLYNTGLKFYYGYYEGDTFIQDYKKAADLWIKAAKQGLPEAQYGLGLLYETGNGVAKNESEALKWYDKAAGQGFEKAINRWNELLRYKVISTNCEKRFDLSDNSYEEANVPIDAEEQFSLGYMYSKEKKYIKAVECYEKAANQGHVKAQYNLGMMYYNGRGVQMDVEKAKHFFTLAAKNGDCDAETFLSELNK